MPCCAIRSRASSPFLINAQRVDEKLALAEEKPLPGEEEFVDSIIASFQQQMRVLWKPGGFERGGNTKTQGIVRAEFIVHDGLPGRAAGTASSPSRKTYRAWVRFSGPGPYITPDIDDVGFMSISIKLMGVPGPKLMDEEKFTQDMFGVSPPTFVTPDVRGQRAAADREPEERVDLLLRQLPPAAPARRHHAGALDQDPEQPVRGAVLQLRAVPARRGPGDAVLGLAEERRSARRSRACRCGRPTTTCAQAMVAALDAGDVELDFRIQRQTDPHLMPIENARRALARAAVAARLGRDAAHSAPEVRLAGADGIRQAPLVQPVALDRRASAARATRAAPAAACTWHCRRYATR